MPQQPQKSILKRPDLLLADRLFLAAHGSVSAELLIDKDTLTLGLGGAMLAELAFAGRLKIDADEGTITPVEQPDPSALAPDRVGEALLVEIRRNRDTTDLRSWLTYLATPTADGDMAYTWIGDRLAGKGVLARGITRKFFFFGKEKTYFPAGPAAELSNNRLISRITQGGVLNIHEMLLAGLIFATGLDAVAFKDVAGYRKQKVRDHMQASLHPPLLRIVTSVESVVGDLVARARF